MLGWLKKLLGALLGVVAIGGCQSKPPPEPATKPLTPLQVKNRATLAALKKAGDDPTKVRVVDHFAYFGAGENVDQYITALKKRGFESIARVSRGASRVKSQIGQTLEIETIDRISAELEAEASKAGGEYDSWGSPVMAETNKNQAGKVDPDQKIRDDIKSSGFSIMSVMESEEGPGFTYSIGIHQTAKVPEVVVIGPSTDLA